MNCDSEGKKIEEIREQQIIGVGQFFEVTRVLYSKILARITRSKCVQNTEIQPKNT